MKKGGLELGEYSLCRELYSRYRGTQPNPDPNPCDARRLAYPVTGDGAFRNSEYYVW
jgi:hypothetical protein